MCWLGLGTSSPWAPPSVKMLLTNFDPLIPVPAPSGRTRLSTMALKIITLADLLSVVWCGGAGAEVGAEAGAGGSALPLAGCC